MATELSGATEPSETTELRVLWDADAIAVLGATDRPGALGRLPVEFLVRHGYDGRIVPVNRKGGTVCGLPAVTSLDEAPGPVDLALVLVPAEAVIGAVADCAAAGVSVAVVMSSGFAETGPEGAARQVALVEAAKAAGVRMVGPNCIGAVGFDRGQVAAFSPLFSAPELPKVPGRIGFATQSGALGYGVVSLALQRGLGLAIAVNTGNEADVTTLEVLESMAADPDVDALLGYTESLGVAALTDGARLRRLASCGKPVALLKAGTSAAGSRAAASHTGAMATSDRVVDAVLAQLGIARARDVDDLLDLGVAFTSPRRPSGPRVAIVTTSGGSGILAADEVEATGLCLAQLSTTTTAALDELVPAFGSTANPVDVTATVMSDPELFDRALQLLADDDGVDALVACFCVLVGDQVLGIVESLRRVAERTGKPVVVARTGADFLAPQAGSALRDAGLPAYPTPARAVRALSALWRTTRPRSAPPHAGGVPTATFPTDTDEPALKALLASAGIPVPRGRLVTGDGDAVAAVREVGGRAVVKAVVPGLLHKSEAGGVLLGVTADAAAQAYERMRAVGAGGPDAGAADAGAADAGAPGAGVLVEEMVAAEHAAEVLVGVAPSPLGSVVALASGGVLTEVLDDAVFRLLPISREEASSMVAELRGARLLHGYRGSPPLDVEALVDALVAVSDLVAGWPVGFELDLNPVLVLPEGVCALDAALVLPAPVPAPQSGQAPESGQEG